MGFIAELINMFSFDLNVEKLGAPVMVCESIQSLVMLDSFE